MRAAGGKRRRPARPRPVLTPEQLHERALHRAWACGERYARRRWRRRPPPRFRSQGPRDDRGIATERAFFQGYRHQVRAMIRYRARLRDGATWSEARPA